VVTLINPTTYFLELTSFFAFLPVNQSWAKKQTVEKESPDHFISNGPFTLATWAHHNILVFNKNVNYWDAPSVKIDQIQIMILDDHTAFQMFETGLLDWTGSPLSNLPADGIPFLKTKGLLTISEAAGTHFFRFNVERAPFNHVKIRKAFSYAIDRQALVEHVLQGGQSPALGFVPTYISLRNESFFKDHDVPRAQSLFNEALEELGMTKDELPLISLSYKHSERNDTIAQAIQQQWKKNLDIEVQLEGFESKILFEKLSRQDYQIGSAGWFADFNDPINFLDVFKYKANRTNNTQWENALFVKLLDESATESNSQKRLDLLHQAETILMDEMPIAPLYTHTFLFLKKDYVQGISISPFGYLNFSSAFIQHFPKEINDLKL
jgi:oligopeptide transport system substrate-binding protein